jgi:hypothetical protein
MTLPEFEKQDTWFGDFKGAARPEIGLDHTVRCELAARSELSNCLSVGRTVLSAVRDVVQNQERSL